MAETKEEKVIREAQEAEAKALLDAEELKIKEEVEQEAIPSNLQEVTLNDQSTSVLTNVHTIYHAKGSTEFVNGVANVNADVAAHLKESGQIK